MQKKNIEASPQCKAHTPPTVNNKAAQAPIIGHGLSFTI